jgi:tRNA G37 N-methylase Trm5
LGYNLLLRNKSVSYPETAQHLEFVHEDALVCMSKLEPGSWDRIIVPRPKQGSLDCDIGKDDCGKLQMLHRLLPLLKPNTGECHFYDFAADHEFPECRRIVSSIQTVCSDLGLGDIETTHVSNAGSVAKRQYRVCIDFQIRSTL